MLLIITTLSVAQAGELPAAPPLTLPCTSCAEPYRFALEGLDAPAMGGRLSPGAGLSLGADWRQPTPVRLTANTVITASGLALTLLSVQWAHSNAMPGDLVPGQALMAGVGGGALLLGGGAMWLTTDFSGFSVNASAQRGVQKGFAIRGVW